MSIRFPPGQLKHLAAAVTLESTADRISDRDRYLLYFPGTVENRRDERIEAGDAVLQMGAKRPLCGRLVVALRNLSRRSLVPSRWPSYWPGLHLNHLSRFSGPPQTQEDMRGSPPRPDWRRTISRLADVRDARGARAICAIRQLLTERARRAHDVAMRRSQRTSRSRRMIVVTIRGSRMRRTATAPLVVLGTGKGGCSASPCGISLRCGQPAARSSEPSARETR